MKKPKCAQERSQRNHIGLAIRAFLRLEMHWFNTGISCYESKLSIVREAVRSYLLPSRQKNTYSRSDPKAIAVVPNPVSKLSINTGYRL